MIYVLSTDGHIGRLGRMCEFIGYKSIDDILHVLYEKEDEVKSRPYLGKGKEEASKRAVELHLGHGYNLTKQHDHEVNALVSHYLYQRELEDHD
ncbi:hypothetical protein AB4342_01290 [Vibrio breoganii]